MTVSKDTRPHKEARVPNIVDYAHNKTLHARIHAPKAPHPTAAEPFTGPDDPRFDPDLSVPFRILNP